MTHVASLRKTKSNFHFFVFLLNCLFIDSIQLKTIIRLLKEITDLSIGKTDKFSLLIKTSKKSFLERICFSKCLLFG